MCATPLVNSSPFITFRQGSDILYPDYLLNNPNLKLLETTVARYEDIILSGNGHIRFEASVPPSAKDDPVAINRAATRAAVIRSYLCRKFRMLTKWCFTFYIYTDDTPDDNSVRVVYCPERVPEDAPRDIYYSVQKDNVNAINAMLSKYEGGLPFVSSDGPGHTGTDAAPADIAPSVQWQANNGRSAVAIYYRWDKSKLDSLYLSNAQNLRTLDSLLTSVNARRIDTLSITAFASPEGDSAYNKRLSERRAVSMRDYIVSHYREIDPAKIVTVARGENWVGMNGLARADLNLPSREKVLDILNSPMSGKQKQNALVRLDGGKTYYRYILPNYYTYLRLGATVSVSYAPEKPLVPVPGEEPAAACRDTLSPAPAPGSLPAQPQSHPEARPQAQSQPQIQPQNQPPSPLQALGANYPFALKTNLLYDLTGALNLGAEVPVGERWSVLGDAAYAYWRTGNHLYAMQTLEYGLSGRYWIPAGNRRRLRNPEWGKPLRGWSLGIYGRYWQRYDVQWIDGCQGDASWSAGITAGYAFPVGRNLSFELGLGAGYFSTSEYRTYDRPLYDDQGNYHLMWRETGAWSGITLTKVNFSLVWLVATKKGGEQ